MAAIDDLRTLFDQALTQAAADAQAASAAQVLDLQGQLAAAQDQIAALQALPGGGPDNTDPAVLTRVDAGGAGGREAMSWSADTGFSGGNTQAVAASAIVPAGAKSVDAKYLATVRNGWDSWVGSLPAGRLLFRLHFVDLTSTAAGQRRMDIRVGADRYIRDLDVFQAGGGALHEVVRDIVVDNPTEGQLVVSAQATVGQTTIAALEVLKGDGLPLSTPIADPAPPTEPDIPTGSWAYRKWANTSFAGTPEKTGTEAAISHSWANAAPFGSGAVDNVTVRWQGNWVFEDGDYTFTALVDDGVRITVDGQVVIDQWSPPSRPDTTFQATRTLTAGTKLVTVEYIELAGYATCQVSWAKVATGGGGGTPPPVNVAGTVGLYPGSPAADELGTVGSSLGSHLAWLSDYTSRDGGSWDTLKDGSSWMYSPMNSWVAADPANRRAEIATPYFPYGIGASHSAAAAGSYDSQWTSWLTYVRDTYPSLRNAAFRVNWEENGTWFEHNAVSNPAAYKAGWHRFAGIFRSILPDGLLVWNCNGHSDLTVAQASMPAAADVDVISVDQYDAWVGDGSPAQRLSAVINGGGTSLAWAASTARGMGKKLSVGEWALWSAGGDAQGGGDNPTYIDGMFDWFSANADVLLYQSYFNVGGGGVEMDLSDAPNSLARYIARATA